MNLLNRAARNWWEPMLQMFLSLSSNVPPLAARPRALRRHLACALMALLAMSLAHARQLSHQNPPPVAPGWNQTSTGKLAAAKAYADWFLAEDARPENAYFLRDITSSAWKDQPLLQCSLKAIMRAIKTKEPYFADKRQRIVVVPVWVELLMVRTSINSGGPFEEQNDNPCTFEYERYNLTTKRFERIADFRTRSFSEEFHSWGGSVAQLPKRGGTTIDQPRNVSIDLPLRYVRFQFRINVANDRPYQTTPQFPRHVPAKVALARLEWTNKLHQDLLPKGISDRDPEAKGKALEDDLERMKQQLFSNEWAVLRLNDSLERLRHIPSFSEIEP